MKSLNAERAVLITAQQLGINSTTNPVEDIIAYCVSKIQEGLARVPSTISELEVMVCKTFGIEMVEVWSDEQLTEVIKKYVSLRDVTFAYLRQELNEHTYGVLVKRRGVHKNAPDRYVAVIDCRGSKSTRRFFTRWHEIAHVLTDYEQLEFKKLFRSKSRYEPIERLVDEIAGVIGFYDPIFRPIVERELTSAGSLTLAGCERIRFEFDEGVSYQAAMHACISRYDRPILYVEAEVGFKKAEHEILERMTATSSTKEMPTPCLRARTVLRNDAARKAGLILHKNMAVPGDSLVSKVYQGSISRDNHDVIGRSENMSRWIHSDGTSVCDLIVKVEARQSGTRVLGLFSL